VHRWDSKMRLVILAILLTAPGSPARAGLYEDLGSKPGITRIVEGMMRRNKADARVGPHFANADLDRLRILIIAQVCELAGGPCRYPGRSMAVAHSGMGVRPRHMNALVENLQDAMAEQNVPFATQNMLLARLAPLSTEIIE